MPAPLLIVTMVAMILLGIFTVFIVQGSVFPRLVYGTLSQPTLQPCVNNTQYILHDCQPNRFTGFGCLATSKGESFTTMKTIAEKVSPCVAGSASTRLVSMVWVPVAAAGPCMSPGTPGNCCDFKASNCYKTARYYCDIIGPAGGEDQCTPAFLPVPPPAPWDPNAIYTMSNPLTLQIPCRENICTTT